MSSRLISLFKAARPCAQMTRIVPTRISTLTASLGCARLSAGAPFGVPARALSSHPDFAPQSKVKLDSSSDVFAFIESAVNDHKVMLFMKGTPEFPRCGFSAQVVRALKEQGADFSSADVLASDELREGIKQYTDWPTIPQLYVNGEFVGGCDVVMEMERSGDLADVLAEEA